MVSREVESRAVADFLAAVPSGPAALVVEGEAGIGKTTVWLAALEQARELGFQVLSTRATSAESVLAYTSLAALLDELDDAAFASLPPPQRLAIDRVLLRASAADGPVTDQRAVEAAFLSIVQRLAEESPVMVAIDDLQWIDPPSKMVISSATRRLTGPIGVLATVRDAPEYADAGSSLELRRPDSNRRIRVHPLSLGATHAVLSERLGRSFSRPKMRRIHEFSGGNPFYALELGRAMEDHTWGNETALPGSLADLVRARLGGLSADGREALLAAACLATPTLELIARATDTDAVAVLEEAENKGIVQIDGHRVNFSHPLLSRGAYTDATPSRRREMHRRLADVVSEPELKARHLALSTASGDDRTLRALDSAAEMARTRGAPDAAADLIELAIGLGGDTPERSIRSAAHHFEAGDPARARSLLESAIDRLAPGEMRAEAMLLLAAVRMQDDSFLEAAALLERAMAEAEDNVTSQVRMSVMLAYALLNGGEPESACRRADDAVALAYRLGEPNLLSQALGMRVTLRFVLGEGVDEAEMRHALELGDEAADVPLSARPAVQNAFLLAWTGQLDDAARQMAVIRKRCIERGEESELIYLGFHIALIQVWRGKLAEAELIAEDSTERALQLNGDLPMCIALAIRATNGAYAGRVDEVRRDAMDALAGAKRCGSQRLSEWPITSLGFLEVSLGNYEAALRTLVPLLAGLERLPNSTEIITAAYLPDAAEAMTGLGRLDDAEQIVNVLERNGDRLDRAWMLAVGARCRSMLLAAHGDLEGARSAAERALREHQRLPMPFELARTQLVMGQIQRRQRHRDAAGATLREALAAFEHLGTRLWADRARAELKRATGTRTGAAELTASEQRVAELAATGITNREMASALFISPKTVEANLSRIYRKLNIRSRAELGRIMGGADE
ncbi:ATP-binding protein [Mycobacterium sp.]|uniref:ATP-binding protein n=1 Tax=Mycobacterium sp. TaxID=1785 RepID=UPI002DABA555|nr:AAA family ATPase [Mycobacterium sp.]